MANIERALEYFDRGAACSQAILAAYGPDHGLDQSLAFRVSSGLGGGIGRTQMVCGAINAGAMVIGLSAGNRTPEDREGKDRAAEAVARYLKTMRSSMPDLTCAGILGSRLESDEEWAAARDRGLFRTVCTEAVRRVAEYLDGANH